MYKLNKKLNFILLNFEFYLIVKRRFSKGCASFLSCYTYQKENTTLIFLLKEKLSSDLE